MVWNFCNFQIKNSDVLLNNFKKVTCKLFTITDCKDISAECGTYLAQGLCFEHQEWMERYCTQTCGFCG